MPVRRFRLPLEKITIHLFERDLTRLRELHPYGYQKFIRNLVHSHVRERDAVISKAVEELSEEVEIGEIIEAVDIGEDEEIEV